MFQLETTFRLSAAVMIATAAIIFAAAEGNPLPAVTLPVVVFAFVLVDRPGTAGLPGPVALLLGGAAAAAALAEFVLGGIEARLLAPAHFLTYLTWIVLLQRKSARQYWLLFGLSILQTAVASLLTTQSWLGLALILYCLLTLWTLATFTLYRATLRVQSAGGTAPSARVGRIASQAESSARSAAELQEMRLIEPRFVGGSFATSCTSLLLAGLFFLFIPRVWLSQQRFFDDSALAAGLKPLTGFSERVTLGDMGEILENDELVLEIQLFDGNDREIPGEDYSERFGGEDPLFRGMTHELYFSGEWSESRVSHVRSASSSTRERAVLRQEVRLHPNGSTILFTNGNVQACFPREREERIYVNRATQEYHRDADGDVSTVFDYVVLSAPDGAPVSRYLGRWQYLAACGQIPEGLERLAAHAQELVLDRFGAASVSDAERAEFLTAYLRDSDEFRYSLSLAIDDPTIDPLEDFVFNRRSGHCEYFSSALAMMLRGVGIPSRLVGGFKGGRFNQNTGRFEVRQLHAHSWVEAYVDSRWVPLDPTPAARDVSVTELQDRRNSGLSRWTQAWRNVWERGVRLSKEDQELLIYQPVRESATGAWQALRDARGSSGRIGSFLRSMFESPERWFSWRGGLLAFLLLTLVVASLKLLKVLAGVFRRITRTVQQTRRDARSVPFFERFRSIVRSAGLERRPAQTEREFAAEVRSLLTTRLAAPPLPRVPSNIVERFYRVRFGRYDLTDAERVEIDNHLDALERALHDRGS